MAEEAIRLDVATRRNPEGAEGGEMKAIKAWAVIEKSGQMAVIDGQVPVYWRKSEALRAEVGCGAWSIARVLITEAPKKEKRK